MVYANLVLTLRETTLYDVILDTGALSRFIHKDVIPQLQCSLVKHPRFDVLFKVVGNHRVNIVETIDISVEVGS